MSELQTSDPTQLVVHAAKLRALARHLVRSEDADDVVQDTMVTALSTSAPTRSTGPWLRQVLRNGVRAKARRSRRWEELTAFIPEDEPVALPDDSSAHAEIVAAVHDALDELDEPYRGVLRDRFFGERSTIEIAQGEGCPHGTVRWRLHEGLRRMRQELDRRFDGRTHWYGAMLALGGPPVGAVAPAQGAPTMMKTSILKVLLSTAALFGAAGVTYLAVVDQAPEAVEPAPANSNSPSSMMVAAVPGSQSMLARDSVANDVLSTQPPPGGDDMPCPGADCDGPLLDVGERPYSPISRALQDCAEGFEEGELAGRLELEVKLVGGPADVGNMLETLVVTRGRKMPCVDDAEEVAPADSPGVERFAALEECLRESIDVSEFDPIAEGKTQSYNMMMHIGEQPENEQLADVELPPEGVDPEAAIKRYGLTPLGNPDAPVSVIECGDYDCPFCDRARGTLAEILDVYEGKVAVYYVQEPLPMHPTAILASRAGVAAQNQGKFWEMHEALFDDRKLRTEELLVARARELGMDGDRFVRDLNSEETARVVAEQHEVCRSNEAKGTPSFFINGDLVVGAREFADFKTVIDDELAGD